MSRFGGATIETRKSVGDAPTMRNRADVKTWQRFSDKGSYIFAIEVIKKTKIGGGITGKDYYVYSSKRKKHETNRR